MANGVLGWRYALGSVMCEGCSAQLVQTSNAFFGYFNGISFPVTISKS